MLYYSITNLIVGTWSTFLDLVILSAGHRLEISRRGPALAPGVLYEPPAARFLLHNIHNVTLFERTLRSLRLLEISDGNPLLQQDRLGNVMSLRLAD